MAARRGGKRGRRALRESATPRLEAAALDTEQMVQQQPLAHAPRLGKQVPPGPSRRAVEMGHTVARGGLNRKEREALAATTFNAGGAGSNTETYPWYIDALAALTVADAVFQASQLIAVGSGGRLIAAALCVVIYSDVMSGLLHIVLDNPEFLGSVIVEPYARGFQEHHLDTTFVWRMPVGEQMRPAALPLVLQWVTGLLLFGRGHELFCHCYLALCVCLPGVQMTHRWAHMPRRRRGALIRALQSCHLLVSQEHHDAHHRPPYDRNFCILTGWSNPCLNALLCVVGPHSKAWGGVFLAGFVLLWPAVWLSERLALFPDVSVF